MPKGTNSLKRPDRARQNWIAAQQTTIVKGVSTGRLLIGVLTLSLLLVLLGLTGILLFNWFNQATGLGFLNGTVEVGPRKAAILDQLEANLPNPAFVDSATSHLEAAGYIVDYFASEDVTIDLFEDLPSNGYEVIIIRAHAGISREIDSETGEVSDEEFVSIFTGEKFNEYRHVREQSEGLVGWSVTYTAGDKLFGFGAGFIERAMKGKFRNTLVVLMGCDGLSSQATAQAFLDKGASAFVSWSRPVSVSHTDRSTERFLEVYLSDGLAVQDAVSETAAAMGPDPWYGGELRVITN